MSKYLTVGELREILAGVPDKTPVFLEEDAGNRIVTRALSAEFDEEYSDHGDKPAVVISHS